MSEYLLPRKFDSGIEIRADYGFVPEIEEREAAVFAGYTWPVWLELPWQERSATVAHYRLHHMIEAHVNEAAEKAAKSKSSKDV